MFNSHGDAHGTGVGYTYYVRVPHQQVEILWRYHLSTGLSLERLVFTKRQGEWYYQRHGDWLVSHPEQRMPAFWIETLKGFGCKI